MQYIIILQARTNSRRLPAKCFLPLAGVPLVELCLKRANVDFGEVWAATSTSNSDDLLAKYLSDIQVNCFRGGLNDVLGRFSLLCKTRSIGAKDTVIRLTGDNPIVDVSFLEQMKQIWEKEDLEYLSAQPEDLKDVFWPKGLSAEFFLAGSLYDADNKYASSFDREHVTPSIKANSKKSLSMAEIEPFTHSFHRSLSIDDLSDYLHVASVFQEVSWDSSYKEILAISKKIDKRNSSS
ncbi:hypothetical protein OAR83_00605 [Alphaproteobacteria bacterium]|nr:hypothetical protein [Alphaproteobacteria bacterium]